MIERIIVITAFLFWLQACTNDSPSTSDVENALISGPIASCPNVRVENVKLINGMKIDDSTHQVRI